MNNTNTETAAALPCLSTSALQLAAASVAGRDHLRLGKNNQDAFALWQRDGVTCAAVADGCGSSPHSEVGAQLGARLLANALGRRVAGLRDAGPDAIEQLLEEVRQELLASLRPIALALAGSDMPRALAASVRDHLLFTLVGALQGPFGTALFALGDGALALGDQTIPLGPFPGNEPPYLGYALLSEHAHGFAPASLRFQLAAHEVAQRPFALGSDGALDLFAGAPPALLLRDPALFKNPDALRRKLWLLAQGKQADAPPLRDDTTLVLARPAQGEA